MGKKLGDVEEKEDTAEEKNTEERGRGGRGRRMLEEGRSWSSKRKTEGWGGGEQRWRKKMQVPRSRRKGQTIDEKKEEVVVVVIGF